MIWVNNVIETGTFVFKFPMFQITVFPFCVQPSGTFSSLTPSGNLSLTTTSLAVLGPLFTTVIFHLTTSPTFTLDAFTNLVISKSQIGFATVVFCAWLLDSFESFVVEFTVTILVKVLLSLTLVTKIRETGSLISNFSISQTLVLLLNSPTDGVAEMISKPSGKVSLTTTPTADEGPLFNTIIVHSTISFT